MKRKHLQSIIDELSRAETAHVAMVKRLSDRMSRIEAAQAEQLKSFNSIMEYLSYLKEAYKKHDGDELDRGQTSSALFGLIKRLDELEKRLLKELA